MLVVGATGALGRPAVRLLRELGVAVRALSRHPDQAADLSAIGAEVLAGDLTDAGSLRRACAGVTRVLACAHSILGALLNDPPPFRTLDIGGHDHAGNLEVATLYAREAGITPRTSHLPVGVARAMGALAAPLHPGMARILRLLSLPDDAFDERFDGAAALEQGFGVRLKRLDAFVRERVAEHRARGR